MKQCRCLSLAQYPWVGQLAWPFLQSSLDRLRALCWSFYRDLGNREVWKQIAWGLHRSVILHGCTSTIWGITIKMRGLNTDLRSPSPKRDSSQVAHKQTERLRIKMRQERKKSRQEWMITTEKMNTDIKQSEQKMKKCRGCRIEHF